MESEDEDVIFENSVLHQALTDIGVTDLKTEPRLCMQDTFENGPNSFTDTNSLPNDYKARRLNSLNSSLIARVLYSRKLLEEVKASPATVEYSNLIPGNIIRLNMQLCHKNFIPHLRQFKLLCNILEQTGGKIYHRYHILKWLIASHLLSEDDQQFLQSYVDEEAPTREPPACLSLYSLNFLCIVISSLILVGVVCPVDVLSPWVALLIATMPQVFSGLHLYCDALSAVLLGLVWVLCFFVPVLMLARNVRNKVVSQMQKQNKHIQDLVLQAEELLRLEKKSLRLIKESELVARGFTLASQHHVASRGSQYPASCSAHQFCRGLRRIMFSENVRVMAEVKNWVVKMLKNIPMICMDSDFSTLEALTLHESQPQRENDIRSDPDIAGQTCANSNRVPTIEPTAKDENGIAANHEDLIISPSDLSRSVELLCVYFSGYVRRLAMCFYPQNLRDTAVNPYVATLECTEMSKQAIERARSLLKQSYTFYRSVHHYDGIGTTKRELESKQEQSETYKLYICVNSLDLHLQSLLQITRNLTVTLEDQVDKEQDSVGLADMTKPSEEDKKSWGDILKRIKSGLESCKGCYEESLRTLHKKTNKADTKISPVEKPSPDSAQPKQANVTWITPEDLVIVDQVFEAINDTAEEEDAFESRPRYTAEDRARHEAEREAITRFRQELHAVVGHRAIFQRAREERALARARGEDAPSQQISQETPSDLVPGPDSETLAAHTEARLGFPETEKQLAEAIVVAEKQPNETLSSQETDKRKQLAEAIVVAEKQPNETLSSQETDKRKQLAEAIVVADKRKQIHQLTKEELKLISYENKEKDNSHPGETSQSQNLETGDKFTDTSICEHFNQPMQGGDSSPSFKKNGQKSFDVKQETDSSLRSVPIQSRRNFEKTDTGIRPECGFLNNGKFEIAGSTSSDPGVCNGMMSLEMIHGKGSCQEGCVGRCSSSETSGSVSGRGSHLENAYGNVTYWGDSHGEIEGNLPDAAAVNNSETACPPLSSAESSDCYETSPPSSNDGFYKQTSLVPSDNVGVSRTSLTADNVGVCRTSLTADNVGVCRTSLTADNGGKNEPLTPEHGGISTFPSMSSSNFTKNIAMMAAFQAKSFNGFRDEEHFGDGSSDSENSDSSQS